MMYVCSESCKCSVLVAVVALAVVMSGQCAQAQPGWILSHQKISDTEGGFTGKLDDGDWFGFSAAALGDLDGDGMVGVSDLLILLANWGPCADCDECPADLNGDCSVGAADLLILLVNWE